MHLALGVLLLWAGCALLWVAWHGIDAESTSPGAIFSTLAKQVQQGGG
jgi:hypothetical protein